MLIYALLHLTGYDLSIEDISNFVSFIQNSRSPRIWLYTWRRNNDWTFRSGHYNAVGMALAEKILASEFNRPGFDIINHYSYTFLGDGCLMEGISHESCSLAEP